MPILFRNKCQSLYHVDGDESTATRRLNLAQAFKSLGSLLGMYTAQQFILEKLNIETYEQRADLLVNNPDNFNQIMMEDLAVVRNPYVAIGAFYTSVYFSY